MLEKLIYYSSLESCKSYGPILLNFFYRSPYPTLTASVSPNV